MTPRTAFRARSARHATLLVALAILPAIPSVAGCRSYERRPIDLSAYQEAFLGAATAPAEAASILDARADGAIDAASAEELALLLNPSLRLARWRAGVVRATAENAGLWQDPTLGFDLTKILEGPSEGWEVLGTVGLTIPISGSLALERDAAAALSEVERARIAAMEWDVRGEVRRAYFDWCRAEAACLEERSFSERLARVLALVETLSSRGELARVEARLFRIEEVEARGQLAELEAATLAARVALLRAIGLPPTSTVAFDRSAFDAERPSSDGESGAGDAVADARARTVEHPAIRVVRAEYEAAERALELEVRRQWPDLAIGPGYGEQDGDRQFVLGLGIALPILNANRQAIAEAEAGREAARVAAEIAVESLAFDRAEADVAIAAARARRDTVVDGLLPLVEAQAEDMQRLARLGGEVDALILLDSLKRGRDARLALVDALHALRVAESRQRTLAGPVSTDPPASEGRTEHTP